MSGLEIVAALGVATSAYGAISGANAKADAAMRDAEMKNAQADELLAREAINEEQMREQATRSGMEYGASWGDTGREGGGIGGAILIHNQAEIAISNSSREANFKARMLRAGASNDIQLGKDAMTAGYLTAGGTVLTGAAAAYSRNLPRGGTSDLPGVK